MELKFGYVSKHGVTMYSVRYDQPVGNNFVAGIPLPLMGHGFTDSDELLRQVVLDLHCVEGRRETSTVSDSMTSVISVPAGQPTGFTATFDRAVPAEFRDLAERVLELYRQGKVTINTDGSLSY